MVTDLQTNIDGVGIYIWEYGTDAETKNTQHTIISSNFLSSCMIRLRLSSSL